MFRYKNTPALLAANAGALDAVCCLLSLGAELLCTNEKGHNLIHSAALRFHTNVLEYFIDNPHEGLSVWDVIVGRFAAFIPRSVQKIYLYVTSIFLSQPSRNASLKGY